MSAPRWSIVVPSLCRPTLDALLRSLAETLQRCAPAELPQRVVVVDDRPAPAGGSAVEAPAVEGLDEPVAGLVQVVRSGGRGPAAARNAGWRSLRDADPDWVVFLDDDVEVTPGWAADLLHDLAGAAHDVAAVQGRIVVPLPTDRRPNDAERNTAGLETACWITADMAVRTDALRRVGGFDERFPRAFREDADLALRLQHGGSQLRNGRRTTVHPARAGGWSLSLRQQRGNADDVLMTRLHGADWYERANAPRGRWTTHLATTLAAVTGALSLFARRPRTAALAAALWAALTAEFAWVRIAPGPRDRAEVARMTATSVLIPPAAVWHRVRAMLTLPRDPAPWPADADAASGERAYDAILLDRDGTIVEDVPYNGDPGLVRPAAGVAEALQRARAAGLRLGVITNQSGIARGLLTTDQVAAVNARVEQLLGPFDTWQVCPHGEADGCACRKPQPGMVLAAAEQLGVPVHRCVVIGDIGADVAAARAAGAAGILVPTPTTRPDEVVTARHVADDVAGAIDAVLAGELPSARATLHGRHGVAA